MATGKRYYWMKLKESFMTSDTIDYFMSQPDGANYVVLYQLLCLKTINTGGRLSRQIGEVIIPFDIEKIRRDCKWFSTDTIRVALQLFQSFGLIYVDVDGTLVLADHDNLVGSETDWGEKKRRQRTALPTGDSAGDNVPPNVPIDNRDKSLDIRDTENREEDTETERKSSSSNEDDSGDSKQSPKQPSQRKVVMEAWNTLSSIGIAPIKAINENTKRADRLRARLNQYGLKAVLDAVENIRSSSFLQGKNDKGWVITFDWFVCPNNFPKVYEGNYADRSAEKPVKEREGNNPFMDMLRNGGK